MPLTDDFIRGAATAAVIGHVIGGTRRRRPVRRAPVKRRVTKKRKTTKRKRK